MTKSIIIARSSTDRHDVSCKSQVQEIRDETIKRGETILKVLEFPRKRHSDFLEDPDFKEILTEAKTKERTWTKIWFYDTSRLSRNRLKAQTTKAFFKRHGIEIEFLKSPKTGEEAFDNVVEGILETFDQLLSDFSRAGSIRGQKQNIRSGYRAGGFAPFGYRLKKQTIGFNADKEAITKSTLEPDPDTFPIVKEFLERRAGGESRGSILIDFKSRRIKSPSGKPYWQYSTCNSIENNVWVYCGHLVYNRHNRKIDGKYVGGKKYRPKDEWEINKNTHPSAISEGQAEAILDQIKKQKYTCVKARTYLLTSILKCGVCRGPMVGNSGYYTCIHKARHMKNCNNNNISADYIDKQVLSFVKDILLTKTHFSKIYNMVKDACDKEVLKSDISNSQIQIDKIEDKISRLMALFERGNISTDILEMRIQKLEEEKSNFEKAMESDRKVQKTIKLAKAEMTEKSVKEYMYNFELLLNDMNRDLMRAFLLTFISEIEIFRKEKGTKKRRKANIIGTLPAFSLMEMALPRGFEPLSPA